MTKSPESLAVRLTITVDAQDVCLLVFNKFSSLGNIAWHYFEFTDPVRCDCFLNALLKSILCVGIIWIHFVLLSEEVQKMSLTYRYELIVF
jgi:hypothetical protein